MANQQRRRGVPSLGSGLDVVSSASSHVEKAAKSQEIVLFIHIKLPNEQKK